MNKLYLYRFARLFLVISSVILGAYALYYVSALTYPFIIALLIAFIMNPVVNLLEKGARLPRSLAVIISLLFMLGLLAGFVTLLVVEIISGTEYLAKTVPHHLEDLAIFIENFIASQLIPIYNDIHSFFDDLGASQQETILTNIQSIGTKITETVGTFIKNLLQSFPVLIGWLPDAATVIIFSLLATFFISKDWYRLGAAFQRFLPLKARKSGQTVFSDLRKALFGFLQAQLTLISITTVIVLIGLLILRVEYAITIAVIIGLVDILPYLGTGLIFIPWIIYAFFSGETSFAVGLSVLYSVVVVQRQVMEPKILSSSIGLDPLATLVSLFVGFKLFGLLGLIAGPVTLVLLKTLHSAHVFRDLFDFIIGKKTD
ncbi:sporulation integral membrane protein YtvI [Priestia abyssalis]|uniref:sporulation integral membrane protein YtvI n=1 Tax=Priestia abyssalis TaxID=1221450 RepID=UPI000994F512|nr:sporulation integral membrane protein YtvI [Priestia abyssalis]